MKRKDESEIGKAKEIKLSQLANISAAIVRKNTSLADRRKLMVHYVGSKWLQGGMWFESMGKRATTNDKRFSGFIQTRSKRTNN